MGKALKCQIREHKCKSLLILMILPAAVAAQKPPNFEYCQRRGGSILFELISSDSGVAIRLTLSSDRTTLTLYSAINNKTFDFHSFLPSRNGCNMIDTKWMKYRPFTTVTLGLIAVYNPPTIIVLYCLSSYPVLR